MLVGLQSLLGPCCVPGLSTRRDWPVRVEGKSKRPSDNWFIKSVWGVEQEPRGCFADVTNCDKITSATRLPLGTLRSNDATATRTSFKVNLRSFSLYRNHYPLTMSNVGEPSWSWIPRDHNHVQKEIKFRLLVQSCCLLIKPIVFSTFALPSASLDLKVLIMADPEDYRHWQSRQSGVPDDNHSITTHHSRQRLVFQTRQNTPARLLNNA